MSLKPSSRSIFLYDEKIRKTYSVIAGVDESGRGPLAGPVVAAAVILPKGLIIKGLKDSKMLVEHKRKRLFWDIITSAEDVGIGVIEPEIIDRINILKATQLAMETAIKDLSQTPDILLIDALTLPGIKEITQRPIIKGESVSASIAAASIVAKTVRDDIMCAYHKQYPIYNFKKHKGYCTKEHIKHLRVYGPCPIHRKSFKKVMDIALSLNYCNI
jgi:ribonuclease HII